MKNLAAFLPFCLLLIFFMPPLAARADLIAPPPSNEFYRLNEEYVSELRRFFIANGEDGSVQVKRSPDAESSVASIPNGEWVHVEFYCLYEGDYWGLVTNSPYAGWIMIEQMLIIYNEDDFLQDNAEHFHEYSGDLSEIRAAGGMITWDWPGANPPQSAEEAASRTVSGDYIGEMPLSAAGKAYMDDDGREWLRMDIAVIPSRPFSAWVCASEPLNSDIPMFYPAPAPREWTPWPLEEIPMTENDSRTLVIIGILIGALIAVTAILIKVFFKPKKNEVEAEK